MEKNSAVKQRILYLDVLRGIATIAVIVMHVATSIQQNYDMAPNSVAYQIILIPHTITRFAVPTFIMISGALMLGRGLGLAVLLKKVRHYIMIFVFWSFLYTVIFVNGPYLKTYSMGGLIFNLFIAPLKGYLHLWFIFLICGLYIATPYLDVLISGMNSKIRKEYVLVSFVLCFILPLLKLFPITNSLFGKQIDDLSVGMFGGYILYFILGYFLDRNIIPGVRYPVACFALAEIIMLVVTNIPTWLKNEPVTDLRENLTPTVFFVTVGLFCLVKQRIEKRPICKKCYDVILFLSRYSFGVYLVHYLVIDLLKIVIYPLISNYLEAFFIMTLLTIPVCYLLSYLLWKTKLTRQIIT